MKCLAIIAALAAASPAMANERVTDVKVFDHTKTIVQPVEVKGTYCEWVTVPIYQDTVVQGDAAGGALAGMIIGGILGKGVSGNDDGAAAGAVIGGLIGADKGAKQKTERVIVDYKEEKQCRESTEIEERWVEVYSHSTIRFYLNGKRYVVEFKK